MADADSQELLKGLWKFVRDEQEEANRKREEVWSRPIREKLDTGWSQAFTRLERAENEFSLWAYLGDGESRFRESDLLMLHLGSPINEPLAHKLTLESEEEDRWLLRSERRLTVFDSYAGGACFADFDAMDMTDLYKRTLEEIGSLPIGRDIILPLLGGRCPITVDDRDFQHGEAVALAHGLNAKQAEAVGLAFGADQVACIQGPPGTGKTRVLALIVRLLVQRGERVLVTSHTHTAINNALNKVHEHRVAVTKVGRATQRKGLDALIACHPTLADWEDRPTDGYVVGATPFATCTSRLEAWEFDTVVFDEASQITVALALMAMRKGRKFVFIGDDKQLPPVVLSRSILSEESLSVFGRLTSIHAGHTVMLTDTYRMNRWLTAWPSRTYYGGKLMAAGQNQDSRLVLAKPPDTLADVLGPADCGIFVPTLDRAARVVNLKDADLVADICAAAASGGLALGAIGIVTPYRAQGRAIRDRLARRFGRDAARTIVADTVERMQGQEREMVILSLATGDEFFLGAVASFFFQPARLNVSITRPMTKLVVIGPALESPPDVDDERVRAWALQYIDLIRHLKRVDLQP